MSKNAGVHIDLAALPDDPATLQQMLRELVAAAEQQHTSLQHAMQQRDAEIDKLHLLIKRLLRQQFGRRSEQLSADQLQLALEDLEQTIAAHEAAEECCCTDPKLVLLAVKVQEMDPCSDPRLSPCRSRPTLSAVTTFPSKRAR